MRFFLLLAAVATFFGAVQADDFIVGPGGELSLEAPQPASWSCDKGTFANGKTGAEGQKVVWKAPLEAGIVQVRGFWTDTPVSSIGRSAWHKVEVVPARLEVKRQNAPDTAWRSWARIVAGGVPNEEHTALWRVIFPTQKDPLAPLPVGRVHFLKGEKGFASRAKLLFDSPTRGRLISHDYLDKRIKIGLFLGSDAPVALVETVMGSWATLDSPRYFQFGKSVPASFRLALDQRYDTIDDFSFSARPQPVRGHRIGFELAGASVLKWDAKRRDFMAVRLAPGHPFWQNVASLAVFSPRTVVSPSGTYRSSYTLRKSSDWLIEMPQFGTHDESQWTDDPHKTLPSDTDWKLKSGATPIFPRFDAPTVHKMLREVERGDNAALLRAGVFGGHFSDALPLPDALQQLEKERKRPLLLHGWLLFQRLRAWGWAHQPHGQGRALAVYAGVFGRSKSLIQKGEKELLQRFFEDWQALKRGGLLAYANAPIPAHTTAAQAAFEAFLRLRIGAETEFDGENWPLTTFEDEGFIRVFDRLQRDSTVPKDFWFRWRAGQVLASLEAQEKLALQQFMLARTLAPVNQKSALALFYADLDRAWVRNEPPEMMSKAVENAINTAGNENNPPDRRAAAQKIVAAWEKQNANRQADFKAQRARWMRERIARTGTGWVALHDLLSDSQFETSQSRHILAQMIPRAPGSEILEIGQKLLAWKNFDPDFEQFDLPSPPAIAMRSYPARENYWRNATGDLAQNEAGRQFLETYLAAPRVLEPKNEFAARLVLARFYTNHGQIVRARELLKPAAPPGDDFKDYRAAQRFSSEKSPKN